MTKRDKRRRPRAQRGEGQRRVPGAAGEGAAKSSPALAPTVEADREQVDAALARTQERPSPTIGAAHALPPIDRRRFDAELDEMIEELERAPSRAPASGGLAAEATPGPDDDSDLLPYYEEEITGPLPTFLPIDAVEDDVLLSEQARSADVETALGAVATLEKRGVASATEGLLDALSHDDPRVVRAVLQAIRPRVLAADARLVALLGREKVLRVSALRILEHQAGAAPASAALQRLLTSKASESWSRAQRVAVLKLLLRWGESGAQHELVEALTAKNRLRRPRVEEWRQEVFEAVQRVGGRRAVALLEQALGRPRLPARVREALEAAMARARA